MIVGHLQRQKAIRSVYLLVAALVAVQVLTPFMSPAAVRKFLLRDITGGFVHEVISFRQPEGLEEAG